MCWSWGFLGRGCPFQLFPNLDLNFFFCFCFAARPHVSSNHVQTVFLGNAFLFVSTIKNRFNCFNFFFDFRFEPLNGSLTKSVYLTNLINLKRSINHPWIKIRVARKFIVELFSCKYGLDLKAPPNKMNSTSKLFPNQLFLHKMGTLTCKAFDNILLEIKYILMIL
jgi:hypothetical protein